MTSNILAGERRWASARRTGMTVLGKVAVPKPLNLPSQRLENHGLDPNVEIVPKGSVGWGSRPSSSASNPWGSSTLSPNADGSANSPSHLSGRPSSGGSGSRPSTAGSERTHERSGNAWGLSSRPSSASGTSSNQTSLTSLRPHSAETRPSSSQLSRFAEPVSEAVVQGPVGTAERVVVTSSENDRFSLISGDFPTLSSSKENPVKNSESRDQGSHSRPSSASGRGVQKKEWAETSQSDVNAGTVNALKRDGSQNSGDGIQPNMEKWHCEPQKYHNANMPPPQFDAWRGPPMNAPAGVWYRGPPPGPPYGAPVPPVGPGGFPVEPFPYYCPQIPPAALANSQPVVLPGAGPRGPRPKNGEMFRPHPPDAFVRPGMPFRPGFYHGPMPFEGYYGPPMGYHNSNEREVPFKGTAGGPSVYNRYPVLNTPDTGNSHARTGMNGASKTLPGQVENVHSDDAPGQYKVLLKQNDEWDANERAENSEHMPTSNPIHPKERGQLRMSFQKNEWGADCNSEDELYPTNMQVGNSSQCTFDDQVGYSINPLQVKSLGSAGDVAVEDSRIKKSEPSSHGMSQPTSASGRVLAASARDNTLIQKIEGLNEKVRASDGRSDVIYTSNWEEQKGFTGFAAHEMSVSAGDKTSELTSGPRRRYDGVRSKNNDSGKRRFNSLDVDGWHKKSVAEDFNVRAANVVSPNVQESKINPTTAAVEDPLGNSEGESLTEGLDSAESQAQRARLRELAKQRAIQLQKEEEERTREQKAKALAKLEELNRRTQGVNALNLTADKALPTGVSQQDKEESQVHVDSGTVVTNSQCLSSALASTAEVNDRTGDWSSEAAVPVTDSSMQTLKAASSDLGLHGPLLPLKEERHNAGDFDCKATPQLKEPCTSRHKRDSHKPNLNTPSQMDTCLKSAAFDATQAAKDSSEIASHVIAVLAPAEVESRVDSSLPSISNNVVESSAQQKRKSNRTSKNKHKLDSAPFVPALPLSVPNESESVELSAENEISNASLSDPDSVSVGAAVTVGDGTGSSDLQSSLHNKGAHGKISQLRKTHQSRRFARNQQSNRFVDKYHGNDNVMWAPVRSQSKPEPGTETGQKTVQESVTSTKGDNQVQSNLKSRRAEMERYVPKPVAKELAQQGSVQQSVLSSVGLSTSDETGEKAEPPLTSGNLQPGSSATGNVDPIAESEVADSKHNKQPKVHGAWRQRGPTDPHTKGLQNVSSSSTSNPSTNPQGGQNQSVKTELNLVKADRKVSREFGASDSGKTLNDSNAIAPAISPQGRDLIVTGKGKRHPLKGERNKGNDNENEKNLNYREMDRSRTQLGDPSINQTERLASSRENKGLEERTSSHWQPKFNSVPNNSLRGSRTITNQSASGEASGSVKMDHPSQPPQHVNNSSQMDRSGSENKIYSEAVNVGHQGHGKEKKQSSWKGRPYSPNDASVADESAHPVTADMQNKHSVSSDFRRNRSQNNRPSSNCEPRADWNQERHRQNAHYEYQPVGPYNNNKSEKFEDVSNNMGLRYKDRGQSHPKRGRGNFHGRQGGNVRADAGYG